MSFNIVNFSNCSDEHKFCENSSQENTTEHFIVSHGMDMKHICPCTDPKYISNGPRGIGPVSDGFPKRLLGGADSLGIDYVDKTPVLSQKHVRIVDYSRTEEFNHPIPDIKL